MSFTRYALLCNLTTEGYRTDQEMNISVNILKIQSEQRRIVWVNKGNRFTCFHWPSPNTGRKDF
jgi:hypothetical protein